MIRPATPADRDAVYEICRLTGDAGQAATGLYDDPDLLGDVYAGPYLVLEPDLAMVYDDDHGVAGYVLGALDTAAFVDAWRTRWLPVAASRRTAAPAGTPSARLWHLLHHPETLLAGPLADYPSHLHIDLLPRAHGKGSGRRLINALLDRLCAAGSPGVHLGVDPRNTSAIAFYERMGFQRLPGDGVTFGRRLGPGA